MTGGRGKRLLTEGKKGGDFRKGGKGEVAKKKREDGLTGEETRRK